MTTTDKATHTAELALTLIAAITTAITLAWVLHFCNYGFEFTDDSFYLNWISNPFSYSSSTTQFGFIYHPLYKLLDGDIATLRQTNIAITFVLALTLCNQLLVNLFHKQALNTPQRLIISSTLAATSLLFLKVWLPTPNYNSLALQAFLVAATGILLAQNKYSPSSLTGWLLIAIGGWLAFMAKPTSAAALGACTCLYLFIAGKFSPSQALTTLLTTALLLFASALAIDSSTTTFITRLSDGVEAASLLGGGHTAAELLRIDNFVLTGNTQLTLLIATAATTTIAILTQCKLPALKRTAITASTLLALGTLAIILGTPPKLTTGSHQSLIIWAIPYSAALYSLALLRPHNLKQFTRPQLALTLTLLIFPHAYAFGTNSNYWDAGVGAAIFWILAGITLFAPLKTSAPPTPALLTLALASLLITSYLLNHSMSHPYRQATALNNNDTSLDVGAIGSKLLLTADTTSYIKGAAKLAKEAGFQPNTPMIDLTGRLPGILYSLRANPIGQAWTIGGYPGSLSLAITMLANTPCEQLGKAWLLTEPGGKREIPTTILNTFGANQLSDFETVGTLSHSTDLLPQQLLKPLRPPNTATLRCHSERSQQSKQLYQSDTESNITNN